MRTSFEFYYYSTFVVIHFIFLIHANYININFLM